MDHYVCKGECRGVSDHAKVCETADCSHQGQSMATCTCEDNSHAEGATSPAKPDEAA